MTTEVRVLQPDDWDRWFSNLELAFGTREAAEEREFDRSVTECERSIGVWDGGEVVGTAGAFSFRLSVPGGALVPAAGVTMVSVAPTHRRRGLLTSMMRRQLDDVRALGEPLAVLTASEPAIYGRFGYGAATQRMSAEIQSARVRLQLPPGAEEIGLRLADPAAVLPRCEELYARQVPKRPGMLARLPGWERKGVLDPAEERGGGTALQCVLAERAGELVGYARYHVQPEWVGTVPEGAVRLRDLEAEDPAAYAALWQYLFDLDLTSKVVLRNRPADDAWQLLVSDIRRCSVRVEDGLYVRPVDVGAALEARTYATDVDVVLEVTDDFCPWNTGRWRLSGGPKGAVCARTDDPAELTLSVRELGAAYLGGVSLGALAAAGRVREERRGALAQAATAFASPVAPWLPHGF
ncbi:GNAT family N-acetyltransferase [Streptomyces cavernicola]|uniref:GNAT family N-acetyltransferase n=1 Tax=Streptomyces cavernicola TaxID=3043613 RepID=A0ABT6SMY2_9ACTN|nr:GNAT family N-acetyltransferase [Streptomyces sp. B-S-A6]MDI3408596.1 GNAT family N-acetyltransferase [Streptomyces sp. B-S-A6]